MHRLSQLMGNEPLTVYDRPSWATRVCLTELETHRSGAHLDGGEQRIASQNVKRKLTARERIVIMPHIRRRRIVKALKNLQGKQLANPWNKHDNMPL